MFAQLILGSFFVIKGIVEHFSRKPNFFISEITLRSIFSKFLPNYLKKVGKTHIVFGFIIISMGQIEYRFNPELWIFINSYIVLGLSCIAVLLYLNKRYSGNYILR